MDGISSRKLTWGICIVGIAIAIISFFFLPEIIPVHFAGNGVADDFGNKIEIFLMPILLLTVTILSGIKSIKYVLMHSKTSAIPDMRSLYSRSMSMFCSFVSLSL